MARTTFLMLALFAALLSGCGGDQGSEEGHGDDAHDSDTMHGSSSHGHDDAASPAGLPEGANTTCPVMGGAVDPEIFTEYEGRTVYFCCDGCIEKFEKDPERYFAKAYPDADSR